MSEPISTLELPGIPKVRAGKVREVFDAGDAYLMVATDRISAFDCILPDPIPRKGEVLTRMSAFWFEKLDFVPNHVIETESSRYPESLRPYADLLRGRSMLVKKATPLPVECVVRGYLAGSGWKEYTETGTLGGHELPQGLLQAERLPETLFTPSTKAEEGHDININWDECRTVLGDELAHRVREYSVDLYEHGRAYAASRGILIADTKFEFGLVDGEVVLIDEVLTPDSSRFWPETDYAPGGSPPSFDKQYVRDYLEGLDWDKTPPAPHLPEAVIERTSAKYIEAYARLTGRGL